MAQGQNAGGATVNGNCNNAYGASAGQNVTGNYNTAIGSNAGSNVFGSGNVANGDGAGQYLGTSTTSVVNNIAIGKNAGSGTGNTPLTALTGNNTISIGTDSRASADNAIALGKDSSASGLNSVAIGAGAVASTNNQIVLGKAGASGNKLITMNGATTFNSPTATYGTTTIDGGFVNINGGAASNKGGDINTLRVVGTTIGNPGALTVSGGAVVNNGLEVNDGLRVTGPSQGQGYQTVEFGGNRLQDVGTPIFATDAANKAYVDRGLNKAYEGTAIALAISQPVLGSNQNFAIRAGWGTYENENAFGLSAAGIIARDMFWSGSTVALDGGVGWGSSNSVAGKAGITIAFGPGAAALAPLK